MNNKSVKWMVIVVHRSTQGWRLAGKQIQNPNPGVQSSRSFSAYLATSSEDRQLFFYNDITRK